MCIYLLWKLNGWQRVKSFLYQEKRGWEKMISKLGVNVRCIIIPIYVNGNHWVVMVRRIQENDEAVFIVQMT